MLKLDFVKPDEATGAVEEAYSIFPPRLGVPLPLQMYSVSPGLLGHVVNQIGYFMQHDRFEFPLLAAIRFIASSEFCYDSCITLNGNLLKQAGLEEKDLEALLNDLEGIPYEQREVALLRFVQKVVRKPGEVTEADVQSCREAGWTDRDIFDASYHASFMQANERLMRVFAK